MNCGTCIYWVYKTQRTGYISEGGHISSRLGKCSNPITKDLVFVVPDTTFSTLNQNILFDESFRCEQQKSNTG